MTRLYNRMICLQTLLKKDVPLRHIDLLHHIEPELATFFGNLPNKPPLDLYFNEMYRKGYFVRGRDHKTKSTTTNMVNYQMGRPARKNPKIEKQPIKDSETIRQEIEALRGREQAQLRSIDFEIEDPNESLNAAQRELAWRGRGADELQKVQQDLRNGHTATFKALIEIPVFQEEIINTLDFKEIAPEIQIRILQACAGMRMSNLKLRSVSPQIDFVLKLEEILRVSGQHLLHLDLSHTSGLLSTAMIAKYCPNLEDLILNDIPTLKIIEHLQKGFFSSGDFNQLRCLSAKQCFALREVRLYTPLLADCDFTGSCEKVSLDAFVCPHTASVKCFAEKSFRPENLKEAALITQQAGRIIASLDLTHEACRKITDASLKAIVEHCPNLRDLNLQGCKLITYAGLVAVAERIPNLLPPYAFGKAQWETYFGDVGAEPPLPPNLREILASLCPFDRTKTVQETFLLVLVPETVNGAPLTLNRLGELVKAPKGGGHATQYHKDSSDSIFKQCGDTPSRESHWVLMSRDVVPGTRDKSFADQRAIVEGFGAGQVPTLLEAAVCILMEHVHTGNRLYSVSPLTFTRCIEKYKGYQAVIGCFTPAASMSSAATMTMSTMASLRCGSCSGRQG